MPSCLVLLTQQKQCILAAFPLPPPQPGVRLLNAQIIAVIHRWSNEQVQ